MSSRNKKSLMQSKMIAFALIITLLIGGMIAPIKSMAGEDSSGSANEAAIGQVTSDASISNDNTDTDTKNEDVDKTDESVTEPKTDALAEGSKEKKGGNVSTQADEGVVITKVTTSYDKGYKTDETNKDRLDINGTYKILSESANGAKITITLENIGENYFILPKKDGSSEEQAAYASLVNSFSLPKNYYDNLELTTANNEKDIIISFDIIAGAQGSSTDFTVNFNFDHSNYDGWVANGTILAEVTVLAEQSGNTSTKTISIKSSASDSRRFSAISKAPSADVSIDGSAVFSFTYHDYSPQRWRNEPGTDYKVVMEYPKGAVIDTTTLKASGTNGTTGIVNTTDSTISWVLGTPDALGVSTSEGWSSSRDASGGTYISLHGVRMSFPQLLFPEGKECEVKIYGEYTLNGQSTPTKQTTATAPGNAIHKFKIIESQVHMSTNSLKSVGGGRPVVNIQNPSQTSFGGSYNNNAVLNDGGLEIPEVCFTWFNDSENSGKKANLNSISLANIGERYEQKIVAYINNSEDVFMSTQAFDIPAAGSRGGSVTFDAKSKINLSLGEYVDKLEIYPIDSSSGNKVYALPKGAGANYTFMYRSWANKKFPNGKDIKHNDYANTRAELTWKGESSPGAFSTAGRSLDVTGNPGNEVYKLSISNYTDQKVYFGDDSPSPYVWFKLPDNEGGSIIPGRTFEADLRLMNIINTSVGEWKNPEVIFIPSDGLEMIPGIYELKDGENQVIGSATVPEKTVNNDRYVHRIKIKLNNPDKPVYKANLSGVGKAWTTRIKFSIKAGTKPGLQHLSRTTATTSNGDTSLVIGTTEGTPNDIIIHKDENSRYLDDSETDWDNYEGTYKLLRAYAECSIRVASGKNMQPYGELYNNTLDGGTGDWQSVNASGAAATVPVNGSGQVQLRIQNVGNTYLGNIRLLDNLPSTDDTHILTTTTRGSVWDAQLKSAPSAKIIDINTGQDVSSSYSALSSATVKYSATKNPTFTANSNGFALGDPAMKTAKAFWYEFGSLRLAPGHEIVITIKVDAPDTAKTIDIGKKAYNSFAVSSSSYAGATGGTADLISAIEPTKQTFILSDPSTATLSGKLFKDYNQNGIKDTNEPFFDDAELNLYRYDENNDLSNTVYRSDITSNGGIFKFDVDANNEYPGMLGGKYKIGITTDSGIAGHNLKMTGNTLDSKGIKSALDHSVNAGEQATITTPFGLNIQSKLNVVYKTAGGKVIGTDSAINFWNIDENISVTPGSTPGFNIPKYYEKASTQTDATTPVKFDWNANGSGLVKTVEYIVTASDNEVVFDAATNGGKVGGANTTTRAVKAPDFEIGAGNMPVDAVKTGYNFKEWNTSQSGLGTKVQATTSLKDIATVYAIYSAYDYKVTFSGNNGKIAGSETVVVNVSSPATTVGDKMPADSSVLRTHYKFDGWSKNQTGPVNFTSSTAVTGDTTVYAIWTANVYTVDFDSQGGTSTPTSVNYSPPTLDVTTLPTAPTKEGFTFKGWFTSPGGLGDQYKPNYTVTKSQTVYANWEQNYYDVKYFKNAGTDNGLLKTDTVTHGALTTGPATNPTYKGYIFDGWYTAPVATGNPVPGTKWIFSEPVKLAMPLYAGWKTYNYTVSFDINGGTSATPGSMTVSSPDTTISEAGYSMPADAKKTGYNFVGWSTTTSAFDSTTEFTANTEVTKNVTVYAIYAEYSYKVTFDGNGGKVLGNDSGFVTVTSPATSVGSKMFSDSDITRPHYTFGGWSSVKDQVADFTSKTAVTKDTTVFAVWAPNSYIVKFDTQGGSAVPADVSFTAPNLKVSTLPQPPTMTGYTFKGWFTAPNGGGTEYKAGYDVTGSQTVYANWEINKYTVTYYTNYGSNSVFETQQNIEYNNKTTKPSKEPTRTGYVFDGWYTSKVSPGNPVKGTKWNFGSDTVTADTNLYAGWKSHSYTVTFNGNGTTISSSDSKRTVKSPDTSVGSSNMPGDPSRTGYTFEGWTTNKSGGSKFNGSTTVSTDITVYAQWTLIPVEPTVEPPVTPRVQGQQATTTNLSSQPNNDGTVLGSGTEPTGTNSTQPSQSTIDDSRIPLIAEDGNGWAVVNLILTIAGLVLAAMISIMAISRKRKENEISYNEEYDTYYEEQKKSRLALIIGAIALSIAGLVLFLLTEDMSLRIVMVDFWTIFNAIIFAIEVVAAAFAFRTKENELDDDDLARL